MTFDEVIEQAIEMLQHRGRLTYRTLKRQFALDDEALEDLKFELIEGQRVAADESGQVLVWKEATAAQDAEHHRSGETTPRHDSFLADSQTDGGKDSSRAEAERRQLTVMFCDLVGSTTLSEQLDPEEYHEVVSRYQATCTAVIKRYAGHIAQHLGDGVLVYFGYPVAHEDDAQRAVRTGLEILTELSSLNARLPSAMKAQLPHPLQVRIGVHTGLVVIGEIGSSEKREILAMGETPNIAARVQGLAEPDTVVMSAVTQRLVQGLFACQDLGPQTLKGISTPLALYRVIGESVAQSRFDVAVGTGLTPLVGREEELRVLQRRWAQAKEGTGQAVLVSGEPGIGKSRLVQELKEQVSAEGATRIEFRCSPYHQNSALYPIIDHLQRLLQFARDDSPATKLEKLQRTLSRYRFPQTETFPLLAALLSLPHPEGSPPLTLSPQKQKEHTQAALVAWLLEESAQRPLYNAWEDLHWADPSTLELLDLLLPQIPISRFLVLLTCRPEFVPPWGAHSYLSQLTLSRLDSSQVPALVARVTRGKALPTAVVQQIVTKTDGVPLFVEELTKMVLESDLVKPVNDHYELTGPLPPLAIPSTLHDSLMARLDRLATVREIAQLGATIGREFPYTLLHAVSPLDEETLQQGLRQLVEAELVFQSGMPPQARYLFKHALVQDTAYQSLLKSRRQQLHQQVAQVLEHQFAETVETQPELVAHHYTEAGLISEAIPYWKQAGQRAVQRSAHAEAIGHLTNGLELLQTLPDSPERIQQELTLQITLGPTLQATRGPAALEAEQVYARARELCQQVGETSQLFPVLWGLWWCYNARVELRPARELGGQLLTLAQSLQDPVLLLQAHHALWTTSLYLGDLVAVREHAEQGMTLYNAQHSRSHDFLYGGHDPGSCCQVVEGLSLWALGYPTQAFQKSQQAFTLAQELSHPHSLAITLASIAVIHQLRHEGPLTQRWAEAAVTLSIEQGFPFWLAWGTILQGWVLTEQGQREKGLAQMRQGLAACRATGGEMMRPHFLALLAEGYGAVGQLEEGLTVLAEALAIADKTGARFNEAELHRLKGELLLDEERRTQKPSPVSPCAEAETCFRQSLDIARRQEVKSWELRAATSLARLWQQQDKKAEARQLLAEIYGWFTEGFDTKDLQEAKALLEELT